MMFDFSKQFKKYNKPFTAIEESDGYYDTETGEFVPPGEPKPVNMQGIILQLSDDDLRFGDGGTFTYEDKKILLDTREHTLARKQTVTIDGDDYQVHEIASYDLYSHFMKAIVKRVSTK